MPNLFDDPSPILGYGSPPRPTAHRNLFDDDEPMAGPPPAMPQAPAAPSPVARALGLVGTALGAPKAGVDWLGRKVAEAEGIPQAPGTTLGQMMRGAAGLDAAEAPGYAGRLGGKALEFGTDIATDPVTYLAGAAGKASPVAGRIAQVLFGAQMAHGALEEGSQAVQTIRDEGLSPKAAEELLGTGLSAGGALMAAHHGISEARAARAARAPLPEFDTEFPAAREADAGTPGVESPTARALREDAERRALPQEWTGSTPPEFMEEPSLPARSQAEVQADLSGLPNVFDGTTPTERAQMVADLRPDEASAAKAEEARLARARRMLDLSSTPPDVWRGEAPPDFTPARELRPGEDVRSPEEVRADLIAEQERQRAAMPAEEPPAPAPGVPETASAAPTVFDQLTSQEKALLGGAGIRGASDINWRFKTPEDARTYVRPLIEHGERMRAKAAEAQKGQGGDGRMWTSLGEPPKDGGAAPPAAAAPPPPERAPTPPAADAVPFEVPDAEPIKAGWGSTPEERDAFRDQTLGLANNVLSKVDGAPGRILEGRDVNGKHVLGVRNEAGDLTAAAVVRPDGLVEDLAGHDPQHVARVVLKIVRNYGDNIKIPFDMLSQDSADLLNAHMARGGILGQKIRAMWDAHLDSTGRGAEIENHAEAVGVEGRPGTEPVGTGPLAGVEGADRGPAGARPGEPVVRDAARPADGSTPGAGAGRSPGRPEGSGELGDVRLSTRHEASGRYSVRAAQDRIANAEEGSLHKAGPLFTVAETTPEMRNVARAMASRPDVIAHIDRASRAMGKAIGTMVKTLGLTTEGAVHGHQSSAGMRFNPVAWYEAAQEHVHQFKPRLLEAVRNEQATPRERTVARVAYADALAHEMARRAARTIGHEVAHYVVEDHGPAHDIVQRKMLRALAGRLGDVRTSLRNAFVAPGGGGRGRFVDLMAEHLPAAQEHWKGLPRDERSGPAGDVRGTGGAGAVAGERGGGQAPAEPGRAGGAGPARAVRPGGERGAQPVPAVSDVGRGVPADGGRGGAGAGEPVRDVAAQRRDGAPARPVEADSTTKAHKFSNTQVDLPPEDARRVVEASRRAIPDSVLGGDGRELRPHVTVKYGIEDVDPAPVRAALKGEGPVKVRLGKVTTFPPSEGSDGMDVVKVDVDSPDLRRLRAKISAAVDAPGDSHAEDYKPHVTLGYVQPGEGARIAKAHADILNGQEITLNSLTFSAKDGRLHEIPLTGRGTGVALSEREQPGRFASLGELREHFTARGVDNYVGEHGDTLTLSRVVVPKAERGQGRGSEFMRALTAYADANGKRIALSASTDFGGSSVARLKEFYKQFGFVENKGRNKDFRISESMIREPQRPPVALHERRPIRPIPPTAKPPLGRSMEPGEAPRVEKKVADLEGASPADAAKLSRNAPRTWESLDPEIQKIIDHATASDKAEADFYTRARSGRLNDVEVQALDGMVRGARESMDSAREALERAQAAGRDTGPENVAVLRAALDQAVTSFAKAARSDAEAGTKLARALSARARVMEAAGRSTPEHFLKQVFRKLDGVTDEQAAALVEKMQTDPANLLDGLQHVMRASKTSQWIEAWKNGLISAPGTQLANVMGNLTEVPARLAETLVSSALDSLTGNKSRLKGEAGHEMRGAWVGAQKGLAPLLAELKDVAHLRPEKIDPSNLEHIPAIPGKLGRGVRTPGRLLEAFDQYFKSIGYEAELHKRAWREAKGNAAEAERLVAEPTKAMKDAAEASAKERTYKDPNKLAEWAVRMRADHPAMHVILPFVVTPANIARLAYQRTPIALFTEALPALRRYNEAVRMKLSAEKIEQYRGEALDKTSRAVVGSAIMGSFYLAAKAGLMTGSGPTDQKSKNLLMDSGWQPYSFALPVGEDGRKVYVPFNRLEPVSSLLGIAADMAEIQDQKKLGDMADKALGSIGSNFLSKTFLTGLSDAANAIARPQEFASQYVSNLAGSVVPNIVAKGAQAVDSSFRDTKPTSTGIAGIPERAGKAIMARLPGVSTLLPAKSTATGEEAERPGNAITRFLLPSQITADKSSDIAALERELSRVGFVPSAPSRTMRAGGQTVQLTDDEYQKLLSAYQRAAEHAARAIKSPTYKGLPDTKDDAGSGMSKEKLLENYFDQLLRPVRSQLGKRALLRARAS